MMALRRGQQACAEQTRAQALARGAWPIAARESVEPQERYEQIDQPHERELERQPADRPRVHRDASRQSSLAHCAEPGAGPFAMNVGERREPRHLEQLHRFDRRTGEQRDEANSARSNAAPSCRATAYRNPSGTNSTTFATMSTMLAREHEPRLATGTRTETAAA